MEGNAGVWGTFEPVDARLEIDASLVRGFHAKARRRKEQEEMSLPSLRLGAFA
jgi:hypothetical protein